MAIAFGLGSACFLVGPFPGYTDLVGTKATAITFFVGSILFTIGGALQTWLAASRRREPGDGRAEWRTAVIQSVGTLCFNVTTYRSIDVVVSNPQYEHLVWRPDAVGSACFLVSGVIGYRASPRGEWMPAVNLAGCVLFGVSAIAGHIVPATGSELDVAAANWTTAAGAACFLACAVGTWRAQSVRKP